MESFRYVIGLVVCAFIMGTVFDVYNTITGASRWLRWLRPALDITFWLLSACLVYYVVFLVSGGTLRLYTLVILAIGYGLYRVLLHRLMVATAFRVVRFARAVFRLLFHIVAFLVFRPVGIVLMLVWWVVRQTYGALVWLENGIFAGLSLIARAVAFPILRFWPADARWQRFLAERWEDFWVWLSKLLLYGSQRI